MWYDVENDNFWGSQATSSSVFNTVLGNLRVVKFSFSPQKFYIIKIWIHTQVYMWLSLCSSTTTLGWSR